MPDAGACPMPEHGLDKRGGASVSEQATEETTALDPPLLDPLCVPVHLRLLAYASLAVAFAVFVFVLITPLYLEIPTVRAVVCMMLSLPISVFFFVFWPQKLEAKVIPLINVPI